MKIAFASQREGWESPVHQRFGRASGFNIYDTKSGELYWLSNEQNAEGAHGVGQQAAQNVILERVDAVVTGSKIGPKALNILQKSGLQLFENAGNYTVKEAYEKFFS